MMSFAQPALLVLLVAVPPLVWWWLRRRWPALRHPVPGYVAGLPHGRSRLARGGGATLRALALVLLIIALAGPRWPDERTRLATEGIAIALLVDVSGSMAERDYNWNGEPISRLDAVKRALRHFVQGGEGAAQESLPGRPDDLIALVTFGTRPISPCPLTLSHSALLQLLDAEHPRSVPGESETNISDALALGLHRLEASGDRKKVMVLLSDGEHNVTRPSSNWTPRQAAQIAANLGVPVYAIDAGGPSAAVLEEAKEQTADPAANRSAGIRTLQDVARITGGSYFQAHDGQSLLEVCKTIDRLERRSNESFQYRRHYEAYPWFALAAFALFIAVQVLECTVWRRVP